MTMPEAPVNEDYRPISGKDQIWPAGQRTAVQPIPKSFPVESAAQEALRFGIARLDARHHARSGCAVYNVHHPLRVPGFGRTRLGREWGDD